MEAKNKIFRCTNLQVRFPDVPTQQKLDQCGPQGRPKNAIPSCAHPQGSKRKQGEQLLIPMYAAIYWGMTQSSNQLVFCMIWKRETVQVRQSVLWEVLKEEEVIFSQFVRMCRVPMMEKRHIRDVFHKLAKTNFLLIRRTLPNFFCWLFWDCNLKIEEGI